MKQIFFLMLTTLLTSVVHAENHRLVKKWESEASLKVPESVLYDAKRQTLYVTNIDGEPWGTDGKGSVGKLTVDGKIVAVDWVSGLDAPKGMALRGNELYVGDMTNLVVIDVEKGKIARRISVPGSEGLNDVTVDPQGVVYISDTKKGKVFSVKNGQPAVFLENLKSPNGLLFHAGTLYLLDAEAFYKVEKDRSLKLISAGIKGGVDGIEHVTGEEFLVSCWSGTVHYIKADGTREVLLDTAAQKINAADIGYDAKNRIVYVPTFFKNSVVAYELQ